MSAQPEYYGLMAFAQAAPAGSRLLKVSDPSLAGLDAWAVRTATGQVHVVVINSSASSHTVAIDLAGATAGAIARVSRLQAHGLGATGGVTLGGQRVSPTTGAVILTVIPTGGGAAS